jgi:hypothetical protein
MEMSSVVEQYYDAFLAKYGDTALPSHWKTLQAILRCRTPDSGELYVQCPDCQHGEWRPLSCGNRHCPKCQNHEASRWIDKQQSKLLPVPYFMVTFTVPFELRPLTFYNQKKVYTMLFSTVASTLKEFGLNSKDLGGTIGMTMVLHTHSRKLDFHPHIHVIVPGGAVTRGRRYWKKVKGKYLFHQESVAKVFRGRFLDVLREADFIIPQGIPTKWVVDCAHVGAGVTALKYLSRYLYRGVISEKNIIASKGGHITFKYVKSTSGKTKLRSLPGEDFLWLILQHVLPQGFRRVRDYGFLHGNAKKLLALVKLILRVVITKVKHRPRPAFRCPCCKSVMKIMEFRWVNSRPG